MKFWDFIRSLFCCCDCDDDNDVQWNEDQTDNRKNSLRKNRKQNSKTKAPIQRVQTTLCLNFSFVYGCKVSYCNVFFSSNFNLVFCDGLPNQATIIKNHPKKGLLHTLLRHWDQWILVAPRIVPLINKIPELKQYLQGTKHKGAQKYDYLKQFDQLIQSVAIMRSKQIWDILELCQEIIYEFMCRHATIKNYSHRDVNWENKPQVYFTVPTSYGSNQATYLMVVCVGDMDHNNRVPIITIFFQNQITKKKFVNCFVPCYLIAFLLLLSD